MGFLCMAPAPLSGEEAGVGAALSNGGRVCKLSWLLTMSMFGMSSSVCSTSSDLGLFPFFFSFL